MTQSPTVIVHAKDLELDESVRNSIERRCQQLADEFHEVARFELTITEAGAGFNVNGHATGKHTDVATLAEHATVPVVNALTDMEHPCQVLADLMTLTEKWGDLQGKTFAYVGDGNNMCHSYMLGAAMAGMHVRIATPEAFAPQPHIIEQAEVIARMQGVTIDICNDPLEAVQGADAVATDTWISMGDEADTQARLEAFQGFTVDEAMMQIAGPDALFLHCLPGHWGEEATYDVAHGPRSVIYDEAENRMWAQMALVTHLLGGPPA